MSHVSAAMAENMMQMPTGKFSKQWAEPQRFPQFLDKLGNMMREDYDWSADIAKLPMPVLLVFADNDSVSQKAHCGVLRALGRQREGAGLAEHAGSKSRLAVVPGYSHYNFTTSAEVPQIIGKFLADPLTNAPAGAAAASQAAPPPEKKQ
jgi:pimeloyl-ACP methyl ester carboxylesterase